MEFDEIKNEIFSKFKHLIIRKEIGTMVETKQYTKKFLIHNVQEAKSFAGEIVSNKLDETDQKIINVLANNARIPLVQLAKEVNSTIKTVSTKMKRMEEMGLIIGYRVSINLDKIGLEYFKILFY